MATYKASYKGIGRMLRSEFLKQDMVRRAERVKRAAEATAPVESGEYKASFSVSSGEQSTGGRRVYARVENDSDHAAMVEFGNSKVDAHHTMRRALLILWSGGV